MDQVFAAPESQTAAFYSATIGTIVFLAALVVLARGLAWMTRTPLSFGPLCVAGLLACPLLAIATFGSTVGHFVSARIVQQRLVLEFAAPHRRRVEIPVAEVHGVLFGMEGKSESAGCYIKFLIRSGDNYRSAAIMQPLSTCKALRVKLSAALQQGN